MKYKVEYSKQVLKFLSKHTELTARFMLKVSLMVNWEFEKLDIKPYEWEEKAYRLRIWKYRFLYKKYENKILIYFYDADSRWDIYK